MINQEQTRIMLFIPRLGGGGAERVFVSYANELVRKVACVHLVCLEGGNYAEQLDSRVQVHMLAVRMRQALPRLVKLLRECKPDVLVSGLDGANLVATIAGRFTSTPVWISVHNDLRSDMARGYSAFGSLSPFVTRIAARMAAGVIAVSQGVADYLVNTLGVRRDKVSVIYNPVYSRTITEQAAELMPRCVSEFVRDDLYFVAAGRFVHQKGFDLLIDAFSAAFPEPSRVKLVILGDGDGKEELAAITKDMKINDRVIFPGFLKNPFSVFARAHMFVLSSRWEGFGNVIIEALGSGTPVLAFDCPSGPSEILSGLPECHVVAASDVAKLSDSMRSIAAIEKPNPEVLIKYAERYSAEMSTLNLLQLICPRKRWLCTNSR